MPKEAICYIPNKLLISPASAREDADLKVVYDDQPAIFEPSPDRDHLTLTLWLMYEKAKGEASQWHPYFEVCEIVDLPCFWPDELLEKVNDEEFKREVKASKEQNEKDWTKIQEIVKAYSPEVFQESGRYDFNLFKWAASFVTSRAFGWGLPHVTLTLIPLVDMFNHQAYSPNVVDLFHSKLHVAADNQIYTHTYEFETNNEGETVATLPEENESDRPSYNVQEFYQLKGELKPEIQMLVAGKTPGQDSEQPASPNDEILDRFKVHFKFENSGAAKQISEYLKSEGKDTERDYEEAKKDCLGKTHQMTFGIQLWGLGFPESEKYEADDDLEEDEVTAEEAKENAEILQRIMSDDIEISENLSPSDMLAISERDFLRQAYQNRWYRPNNQDTYIVLVNNRADRSIKAGEEIIVSYGSRSNAQLLEK